MAAAISDLLVRRVDPEHGRVLVGGVDTRELSLDALRAHVVTVDGHHPWLVDGTLGENLALGAPDADPVDVGTRAPRTRRVKTCSRAAAASTSRSASADSRCRVASASD